jgi:hypothetical protein
MSLRLAHHFKISPSGRNDKSMVYQPVGDELNVIIAELNEALAA